VTVRGKWTNGPHSLYKARMTIQPSFLESLHYVPEPGWAQTAYSVVRAGKVSAGPDYRIVRDMHIGQDILYCLSGAGIVETLGHRLDISAGQMAWIANEHPHAHYADRKDPWTLLWFRLDGPDTTGLRSKLFGDGVPLVSVPESMSLQSWFDRLFLVMRGGGTGVDLRLNQLVGEFFAVIDQIRHGDGRGDLPEPLKAALLAMRADLRRLWDSEDLSALTRLSASHVRRLFRKHLRTSPHQWLLRERLTHAQTLIADSAMPLAEIAETCGFCDVYHFSREFKQSIGTPPAAWRRKELGKANFSSASRAPPDLGAGVAENG
jgi:AraC-like DNA-binding protein/mannose-6-phosphate isomerase-like protein (cupin superfamily)